MASRELSIEKNSRTEMLPGKRDFFRCCKARRRAPHTRKQRVLAAISKLRSAFFTGYKNKICTYYLLYNSESEAKLTNTDEKNLKNFFKKYS